ncbi:MAG TPA: carbohydrate ABC transporter permease [Chloroflexota bacterium]|nr:carbohydrate ABC transporter permease [Chloroflexota bacterium]
MSIKAIPARRAQAQPQENVVGYRPRWYTRTPVHVVVILISVIWLLPTLTLLFTSVRSIQDINTSIWWTLLWTPHQFTLQNYSTVLHTATSIGMGQAFLNSLIITIPATILPILIGAGAAYAFAWLRFPLRNTIFLVLVALQVIPLQMLLIPLLRIFTDWHIVGTYAALWVAHTAFGLPLIVYILRNFMSGIPYELLEAGRIDGAGDVGIFARIILPLTIPAIAAVAIFQFMWVWNDLLVALVFSGSSTAPMTVIVRSLVGAYGNGWHLMTAAAFISMVLPLTIFFSLQRYFVTGLTAGAVKG